MHTDLADKYPTLLTAIQAVAEQTNQNDLATVVVHELRQMTEATGIYVLLKDELNILTLSGGIVEQQFIGAHTLLDAYAKNLVPDNVIRYALFTQRIIDIPDLSLDKQFAAHAYFSNQRHGSLLVLPILTQQQVIGVFMLENRRQASAFSSACIDMLKIVGKQLATCLLHIHRHALIERQLKEKQLHFAAIVDKIPSEIEKNATAKHYHNIDIFTLNQYQKALTNDENLLSLCTDNSPFAILLTNKRNQILYLNRKFTELLGYTKHDIFTLEEFQQHAIYNSNVESDTPLRFNQAIQKAFIENQQIEPQEFLLNYKERALVKYIAFAFASSKSFNTLIGTENTLSRQANLAFGASNDCFRTVFEKANVGIAIADTLGYLIKINDRYAEMFGYTPEAAVGLNTAKITHPDDLLAEIGLYQKCLTGELDEYSIEKRWIKPSGEILWVETQVTITRDEERNPLNFIGILLDITKRKNAEASLIASEERFRQLFDKMPISLALLTPNGTITHVNARFIEIFGYSLEDTSTMDDWWGYAFPNPEARCLAMETWELMIGEAKEAQSDIKPTEFLITCKNGMVHTVLISAVPVGEDLLITFIDISEQKLHQKKLERIAHYDSLTNLPNRVLLIDRLNQSMLQAHRQGQHLAIVYLDLDGFKTINDTHGHDAGDHLLLIVATRMKFALRDIDTIARLGGDEFVAVIYDAKDMTSFTPLINRLLDAARQPVITGNLQLQVSASLGVSFYPQKEEVDADQLLRQADQAMYQAKLLGKNQFVIYDPDVDPMHHGEYEGTDHIRLALNHNELVLYYQPKVNLKTGEVIGVEALIRWLHPASGLITPERFLPVIEHHPLIIEVGEWVIQEALCQIERWQALGLNITVSVNIAALHLQQTNFIERLKHLLSLHPTVDNSYLELELLENNALEDMERASEVIQTCQNMNIRVALDDFGTGYSSLSYLKRLPTKILKIDKSFVRDMIEDPEDLAIFEGILSLAVASKRQVIAEGVETKAHCEMLLMIGCFYAQGYGIAQPMLPDILPNWLKTWCPDPAWARCSTLSAEELPLLTAIIEHRAWNRAMSEFFEGSRTIPPYYKNQIELSNWLQINAIKHSDKHLEFQSIDIINKQLHELASELLIFPNPSVPDKKRKMTTLFSLSGQIDTLLQSLLDHLQAGETAC